MPILALIVSSFVTVANAKVVIEPYSAELKHKKAMPAHTSAIYAPIADGPAVYQNMNSRNMLFPRLISEAAKANEDYPIISVVLPNQEAIDWFRATTAVMEYDRFLSPFLAKKTKVQWTTREAILSQEPQILFSYWIVPFSNPLRSLENANEKDIQWSAETLMHSLNRYITLKKIGIKASFVLDIVDGGVTAQLAHWVLENINVRLVAEHYSPIDLLIEANTADGVQIGHHDHPSPQELVTPTLLQKNFPAQAEQMVELIHGYTAQLKALGKISSSGKCDTQLL